MAVEVEWAVDTRPITAWRTLSVVSLAIPARVMCSGGVELVWASGKSTERGAWLARVVLQNGGGAVFSEHSEYNENSDMLDDHGDGSDQGRFFVGVSELCCHGITS